MSHTLTTTSIRIEANDALSDRRWNLPCIISLVLLDYSGEITRCRQIRYHLDCGFKRTNSLLHTVLTIGLWACIKEFSSFVVMLQN
jgi:hypothetical protein